MSCHWYNCLNALKGDAGQVVDKVSGNNSTPPMGGPRPGMGFNSVQPVTPPIGIPNGGNIPSGLDGGSDAGQGGGSAIPGWLSGLGGFAKGLLPKNAQGGIDWGKLAGIGLGGAGVYTAYENGKAEQEYMNKLLGMKEDQIASGKADYASRAPVRSAVQSEVLGKLGNQGKNIFSKYTGQ